MTPYLFTAISNNAFRTSYSFMAIGDTKRKLISAFTEVSKLIVGVVPFKHLMFNCFNNYSNSETRGGV